MADTDDARKRFNDLADRAERNAPGLLATNTDDADRDAIECCPCYETMYKMPDASCGCCELCLLRPAVAAKLRERDERISHAQQAAYHYEKLFKEAEERIAALEAERNKLKRDADDGR